MITKHPNNITMSHAFVGWEEYGQKNGTSSEKRYAEDARDFKPSQFQLYWSDKKVVDESLKRARFARDRNSPAYTGYDAGSRKYTWINPS
jgi:hypothetical protein